ncbi:MAG: YbaB/EbfC family nucleoid-associated protein [Alphaproteobacteria bacterium]|nr:YbaB/EbfC family nucleoid-associated protein [Alphaproteobacteria bacterium]
MKNLGSMLKQAQQIQNKMSEMQNELDKMEVTGSAGGGMVQIVISGKNNVRSIQIDPQLLKSEEKEILEDLIVAAFQDAKTKVEALASAEMAKITGGLPLPPGFKLPF